MNETETTGSPRWRLKDLITYECALARDRDEEWGILRERDAGMALGGADRSRKSRRRILLSWLNRRLEQDERIHLAAESVTQSLSLAGQLLGLTGFLIGLSTAAAALAYTGEAPINVSAFFAIFILLQFLLALALVVAFSMPRRLRERLAFGPVFRFFMWVLEIALDRAQDLYARYLSGKQRKNIPEWAGSARRALALHGSVSKWVAFVKIQAAALFFNLGALIALLFAVFFSDRAFGWQTTLQVSGETVHQLVRWAALPWSWHYGEGLGYPSLAQIEGSRIVLKEGIQTLQNQHLASWWRFLALGIVCYGILPRLFFYLLGKWQVRSVLARLDFRNADSEKLMERLLPPPSLFVAEKVEKDDVTEVFEERELVHPLVESGPRIRCLCGAELAESMDPDALRAALARHWGQDKALVDLVVYKGREMDQLYPDLKGNEQVAILYESWMPPIKEHERQLKTLRKGLGKHVLIKLVLLGIPGQGVESVCLKPEKQYLETWKAFLRRMGDPYLMLEEPRR